MNEPVVDVDIETLVVLTPEEEKEHLLEQRAKEMAKLKGLIGRLQDKRDECVRAKRPIEAEMINSLRLYAGSERIGEPTKAQPTGSPGLGSPTPHLIRARTDRWHARICDMLSANPYGLDPEEGTSQEAADGMKAVIDQQLGWCKFPRLIRHMAKDAARIGTGLLIGPRNAVKTRRVYQPPQPQDPRMQSFAQEGYVPAEPQAPVSVMVTDELLVPEIREGDPFNFFPDMVERPEKAEYAFYVYLMGPMEVKNLKPDFDEDQINALLRTEPDLGELRANLSQRAQYLNQTDLTRDRYAVWHFTGVLDKEDLQTLGLCECDEETDDQGMTTAPPMAMADVWFCQDFVLRARLAPVPDDFRIPYYVFSPFPMDGTMFGKSLPMLGEDSQRVAKAAWVIALHNASVSSGPLIVQRAGMFQPADGQFLVRGPKTILMKGDSDSTIEDNFKVINIPNNVNQALQIFDRAIGIMDEELNTSQWASPEGAEEVPTASGLAMVMNVRSILQAMVAAAADDEVLEPMILRMCWWNNDSAECPQEIKGNYQVKPLVQSQKLVKDVQAQQATMIAQLSDNPRFAKFSNDYELWKYLLTFVDGPVAKLLKPETQVAEEAENAPPDPAMLQQEYLTLRAQTEQARAETERIKAEAATIEKQRELLEMQLAVQMQGQDPNGETGNQAMTEFALKNRALDIQEQKVRSQEEIAVMKQQAQEQLALVRLQEAKLRAEQFAYEKQQDRQARVMTDAMKLEGHAQEIALKRQTGSGI